MSETVPYAPRTRYIEKNLAPEKMPKLTIQALANQARAAVDSGMLSRQVVDLMLPNLMIEGRSGDYGVNAVDMKEIPASVRKALKLDDEIAAGRMNTYITPDSKRQMVSPVLVEDFDSTKPSTGLSPLQQNANAKLKVAALTVKQATAERKFGKEATAEQVIQLWNGAGPDSRRHLSRVVEAAGLLSHGSNKQIKGLWDAVMAPSPNETTPSTK